MIVFQQNHVRLKTFNYYNINSVARVRMGNIPLGTVAGAVTGALIGLATYQKKTSWDFGPGAHALVGGILGIPVGTLAGVLIYKEKFSVNRDINTFQKFKSKVVRKAHR